MTSKLRDLIAGRLDLSVPLGDGPLSCDRAWPTRRAAWTARLRGRGLSPDTTWALLRRAGSWPRPVERMADARRPSTPRGVDAERVRWLLGSVVAAWRMRDDPVLEGAGDPTDPASLGLPRDVARARVLGYKPLRRVVVRFDDDAGDARRFVKHLRPGRAGAIEAIHAAAASWARATAAFTVPELLETRREPDLLICSAAHGSSVESEVRRGDGEAALAAVGRCLGALHRCPARLTAVKSRRTELADTEAWLSLAERLEPVARLRPALEAATRAERGLRSARPVVSHADAHDGQFLISGGRACMLDYDTLAEAEPELDLGNLLAHLDLLRLRYPETPIGRLENALLETYRDEGAQAPDAGRLAWYRAVSLLRLACVHSPRPETGSLTGRLVDLAERRTQDLCENREELAF